MSMLLALSGAAHAACPEDIHDCLGRAADFEVVATKLGMTRGVVVAGGTAFLPAEAGNVCMRTGSVGGPSYDDTRVDTLVATGSRGNALRFVAFHNAPAHFHAGPGVTVGGDVVTGGGAVTGTAAAVIAGFVDRSGADPRVATCTQALADAVAASQALAALSPTQNLGAFRVKAGASAVLTAGPGVNVWSATELTLLGRIVGGAPLGAALVIRLDPATDAVIVNTRDLDAQLAGNLAVDGDAAKVVINVAGKGRHAAVGQLATIPVTVLAPQTTLKVGPRAKLSGTVAAAKLVVQGACVKLSGCP